MMKPLMPDTNVLIDILNGRCLDLRKRLAGSHQVLLSIFVEGEYRAGLSDTARGREARRVLEEFLSLSNVVQSVPETSVAKRYGEILQDLQAQGSPIPTNDIWIAAHALDANATLVTSDLHFKAISFLDASFPE